MDNLISNEWLEFPLAVFIDTQVFINESYDFSERGKLDLLKKQIDNGKVELLTTEIVIREVERHMKDDIGKGLEKLNNALFDRRLAVFREGHYSGIFKNIDSSTMISNAIQKFNDYLFNADALLLDVSGVDLCSVINKYFLGEPPFGEAHKKNEFPDAFNASLLYNYSCKNGKVYVVSGDRDFSNIANMYCFKTLNELLDAINSQDNEVSLLSKEYVNSLYIQNEIFTNVKEQLLDVGCDLYVDGTDTDRKGVSYGFEYDNIELESVFVQNLTELEVVDIDYAYNIITIMTTCKAELEFDCTFFDEDNSIWNSDNKEFEYVYYGIMNEIHNALIPITIYLAFQNEGEDINFDIDKINVDTNLEFNQYTLQRGGRCRVDNPYSDLEDKDYESLNYCPDCGVEINFENDGGNGFCINCALNH
jgi:conserved uncharacterized protein